MNIQKGEFTIDITKFAAITKSRAFSYISMDCLDFFYTNNVDNPYEEKANGGNIIINIDYYSVFHDNLLYWIETIDVVNGKEKSKNVSIAEIVGIVENIGYNLSTSIHLHKRDDAWENKGKCYHNPIIVKNSCFDLYEYIFQDKDVENTITKDMEKVQKLVRKYEKKVLNLLMAFYDLLGSEYLNMKLDKGIVVVPMQLKDYLSNMLTVAIKTTSKLSYFINFAFLGEEKDIDPKTIVIEIEEMTKLIEDFKKFNINTIYMG